MQYQGQVWYHRWEEEYDTTIFYNGPDASNLLHALGYLRYLSEAIQPGVKH
jgi:hypothetical protein